MLKRMYEAEDFIILGQKIGVNRDKYIDINRYK